MSTSSPEMMAVEVTIVGASGLSDLKHFTGEAPYCQCEVEFEGRRSSSAAKVKTSIARNTFEPIWNETHVIDPFSPGESLVFSLFDKSVQRLGKYEGRVALPGDVFHPHGFEGDLPIAQDGNETMATLQVKVSPPCPCTSAVPNSMLGDVFVRQVDTSLVEDSAPSLPAAVGRSGASLDEHITPPASPTRRPVRTYVPATVEPPLERPQPPAQAGSGVEPLAVASRGHQEAIVPFQQVRDIREVLAKGRIIGERHISREELAALGNLIQGSPLPTIHEPERLHGRHSLAVSVRDVARPLRAPPYAARAAVAASPPAWLLGLETGGRPLASASAASPYAPRLVPMGPRLAASGPAPSPQSLLPGSAGRAVGLFPAAQVLPVQQARSRLQFAGAAAAAPLFVYC